jgi:nucleoside 2-deoxyribosyltransferase
MPPILLVGEVIVDVNLSERVIKLRLGGVFHAARALWALGAPYDLAYIAPSYLDQQIEQFGRAHGAGRVQKIGNVTGAPNVILIHHAQEAHQQIYELLLREHAEYEFKLEAGIDGLEKTSDVLLFPGRYPLLPVLKSLSSVTGQIHIDWANSQGSIEELKTLNRPIKTFIVSTSSDFFLHQCNGDAANFPNLVPASLAESILLKENRGGSRLFSGSFVYAVGSQLRPVQHSVGIGDCFNAAYIVQAHKVGVEAALHYASWVAGEYATTTFPDDFKSGVEGILLIPSDEITQISGISLPWEERSSVHIYIAAADFDYRDNTHIDRVSDVLTYHNFVPHRPVRENGQASTNTSDAEKRRLCGADMRLLEQCRLVVAVYEDNDPGTLIEIGIAIAQGKPVIVYDPYSRASNLILQFLPSALVHTLDELAVAIFTHLGARLPVND